MERPSVKWQNFVTMLFFWPKNTQNYEIMLHVMSLILLALFTAIYSVMPLL